MTTTDDGSTTPVFVGPNSMIRYSDGSVRFISKGEWFDFPTADILPAGSLTVTPTETEV